MSEVKDAGVADVAQEPYDSEKVQRTARQFSIGHLSENREDDFLTRNGLNIKSFQRRELPASIVVSCEHLSNRTQVRKAWKAWLSSIAP